jgi:hypothetical protein
MADRTRLIPDPAPLRAKRCETCVHFADEVLRELPPTCRINPMVLVMTPQGVAGTWPPTKATYWCGHWKGPAASTVSDGLTGSSITSDA